MADIRIDKSGRDAVTLDWLQTPAGLLDETQELATAVRLALGTDRIADASDELPDPDSDDRRGWWGDAQAKEIWNGWPVGSRLWLISRASITNEKARRGSTAARVEVYIREALQPFRDAKIVSRIDVNVARDGLDRIGAEIILYRGPLPAIALQFQDLWNEI